MDSSRARKVNENWFRRQIAFPLSFAEGWLWLLVEAKISQIIQYKNCRDSRINCWALEFESSSVWFNVVEFCLCIKEDELNPASIFVSLLFLHSPISNFRWQKKWVNKNIHSYGFQLYHDCFYCSVKILGGFSIRYIVYLSACCKRYA